MTGNSSANFLEGMCCDQIAAVVYKKDSICPERERETYMSRQRESFLYTTVSLSRESPSRKTLSLERVFSRDICLEREREREVYIYTYIYIYIYIYIYVYIYVYIYIRHI